MISYSSYQLVEKLTSKFVAKQARAKFNDSFTSNDPQYYGAARYSPPDDHGTSHTSVVDGDGMAVAVTSTINT